MPYSEKSGSVLSFQSSETARPVPTTALRPVGMLGAVVSLAGVIEATAV